MYQRISHEDNVQVLNCSFYCQLLAKFKNFQIVLVSQRTRDFKWLSRILVLISFLFLALYNTILRENKNY